MGLSHECVTSHFQIRYVASILRGMRDLFPTTASGRFAPSATVVIFYHFDSYVASFLRGTRDLFLATASGRFAPSSTVVIFYYFDDYVASILRRMRDLGLPDLEYRLSFHGMHAIESYLLRCTQNPKKNGMTAYAVIPRSKNHILRGY